MVNLFLLSRKAFVMCYCFRAPIKTFFFGTCQMTVKSCILHLFPVPQTGRSHIINILLASFFSVRTLNYGSSFFFPPKTRLIRGIYATNKIRTFCAIDDHVERSVLTSIKTKTVRIKNLFFQVRKFF